MCGHSEKYATFHWHSLLQPFWTFYLEAIQPKSKKRNLGNKTRCLTENKTWPKTSGPPEGGKPKQERKATLQCRGGDLAQVVRSTSWFQWRFGNKKDQRIRNFWIWGWTDPEIWWELCQSAQKDTWHEDLQFPVRDKAATCCNFQRLSFQCHWHVRKDFSCSCCPLLYRFIVPGWVVYTFCWSSAIASHRNMLGRSNFETSSFTLS